MHCSWPFSDGTSAAIQDAVRASPIEQAAHQQAALHSEPAGSDAGAGGPVSSLLTPQVRSCIPSDTPSPSPRCTSSRHAPANLHFGGLTTACTADVSRREKWAGVITLATGNLHLWYPHQAALLGWACGREACALNRPPRARSCKNLQSSRLGCSRRRASSWRAMASTSRACTLMPYAATSVPSRCFESFTVQVCLPSLPTCSLSLALARWPTPSGVDFRPQSGNGFRPQTVDGFRLHRQPGRGRSHPGGAPTGQGVLPEQEHLPSEAGGLRPLHPQQHHPAGNRSLRLQSPISARSGKKCPCRPSCVLHASRFCSSGQSCRKTEFLCLCFAFARSKDCSFCSTKLSQSHVHQVRRNGCARGATV